MTAEQRLATDGLRPAGTRAEEAERRREVDGLIAELVTSNPVPGVGSEGDE